jgi:rhodanese-related sulfurtransferase
MYRKLFVPVALLALIGISGTAWSYDQALAGSYAQLFEPVAGAQAGKALHLMTPEALVAKINTGEPVVTLDVRTPGETRVFTLTLPGALAIPVNELFKPESLARIPTDKPVVVICHSGARALVAGTALRHIGFDNVYILKGGFHELAGYLDAKTANPAPKAGVAK